MTALPPTSRLLDTAEQTGFDVKYHEDCSTGSRLVMITGKHLRGPVVVEVECARNFGLVFRRRGQSTYRSLAETAKVLGISL